MTTKLYRLSITTGSDDDDKYIISDCVFGKDIYLASFYDYNEVTEYLDTNFMLIGKGRNYNYYVER